MKHIYIKYQKVISITIAFVLLLNCGTFSRATQIELPAEQGTNDYKIEGDLREAMDAAGDDELIPICLWRKKIDSAELNALIRDRSGFDPEIYEDYALFNEIIVPEIEEEVLAELHFDNGLIAPEIEPENYKAKLVKETIRERIDEYIHQKRLIAREEYTTRNAEFLEKYFTERDDRHIFYCSKYTSTIFIEATKPEIVTLTNDETVDSISLHVTVQCTPTIYDALSQVGVYCQGGTGYGYDSPNSSALTGAGIKIGVIECSGYGNGGQYHDLAVQLYDNPNLHFIENIRADGNNVPHQLDYHATSVMSIIAGQTLQFNNTYYRGIVPDATVFQTPAANSNDILTGIEACIQQDVSIINISIGCCVKTYYSELDRQVDLLFQENNVVIVVSAGNIRDEPEDYPNDFPPFIPEQIYSPASANNVIAVGYAETKIYFDEALSAPYSLSSFSCFSEPPCFANKPDLVAPGKFGVPTFPYYENHGYGSCGLQPDFIEGTSFSAPIVTGIAAQILENNPAFSIDPTFVKAALLLGADLSAMNTMGDSQTTQHVYNKNGAGMVNAINSIDPRIHIEYYGAITQSVIPMNTYDYYFYAGDRVRAVLTFNKYNDLSISSPSDLDDLDLLLVRRDTVHGNQLVACSDSLTNNNEIIDIEITDEGEYYFIIYVRHIADINNPPVVGFEFLHDYN